MAEDETKSDSMDLPPLAVAGTSTTTWQSKPKLEEGAGVGAGDAAALSLPLPRVPDTGKVEKASVLKGFAVLTYIGLVFFILLLTIFVLLLFVTASWFSLYHEAQETMPKTFVWEQVITLLGSYYKDCFDRYSGSPLPRMMWGKEWDTTMCDDNSFTLTLPWIPLVGGIFSLLSFTFFLFAVMMLYKERASLVWIKLLLLMCILETYHFTTAMIKIFAVYNSKLDRETFKEQLRFRMGQPNQLLSQISSKWKLTQAVLKCCGLEGEDDWKFSIFRFGDPRYPTSCCNRDEFLCPERYFPTRHDVWRNGCLDPVWNTITNYKNWEICLLILTYIFIVLATLFASQLYIFVKRSQFRIHADQVRITLFGKSFIFKRNNNHPPNLELLEQSTTSAIKSTNLKGCSCDCNQHQRQRVPVSGSKGVTSVAINGQGIFVSSEITKTKSMNARNKETWV
ncbi:unnamed protein product [Orchesella dallaii]|uniref:Tetraspanin n=1 Tax=Orchesella dallaii TaxID=48710 RepID=A0ABP1R6X9_9HEXA